MRPMNSNIFEIVRELLVIAGAGCMVAGLWGWDWRLGLFALGLGLCSCGLYGMRNDARSTARNQGGSHS